jgi:hypothetical protein
MAARASIPQHLLGGGTKPERLGVSGGDRSAASRDTVYRKPAAAPARRSDTTSSTKKSSGGGGKKAKPKSGFKLPASGAAPIPTARPMEGATTTPSGVTPPTMPSTFPARPEVVPIQMDENPAAALAGSTGAYTGAAQPPMSPAGALAGSTGAYTGAAQPPMSPAGALAGASGPYTGAPQPPMDPAAMLAGSAGAYTGAPQPPMSPAGMLAGSGGALTGAATPVSGLIGSGPGRNAMAAQMAAKSGSNAIIDPLKMDLNYKTPGYHLPGWLGGTGG